jgi:serine/threonine protein phosphatase PrpC
VVEGERFCENCGADLPGAGPAGAGSPGAGFPGAGSPGTGSADAGSADAGSPGAGPEPARALREGVVVAPVDLELRTSTCAACGGAVAPDGYCEQCGTPAPNPRDHWVDQPAPWVVAVCDRGVRHPRNEDAVAVAAGAEAGSFAVLVVCDGVSSAPDSDQASLAAARAARDVLAARPQDHGAGSTDDGDDDGGDDGRDDGGDDGGGDDGGGDGADDPEEAMERAGAAAHEAASAVARRIAGSGRGNPPSTTFVAAVLRGRDALVGWVGDSRAYWVPDDGPAEQLSVDDSWAAEAIALGVPRKEAESGPQAHAITRWLGADAPEPRPRTVARRLEGAGWLLLCSDGLWNYCSDPGTLAELVADTSKHAPGPRELAEALVQWAVEAGGADNISVALARVED